MEKIKVTLPKIKVSSGNRKLFETNFLSKTLLFTKKQNFLKSKTHLNPANEGRLSGAKQKGMSKQMKKKR